MALRRAQGKSLRTEAAFRLSIPHSAFRNQNALSDFTGRRSLEDWRL
jgi:hypothetical protein